MFEGVLPAIITPFKCNSAMDLDIQGLERNIRYLVSCGIHGIVPCGSTGESATLTFEEHEKVIETTIDIVNGKIP
ncbi:MAG: dihydrodipicolinate synthase family protein, partial [Methanoregula sp.]|nr:dihydrodipicolinate synthase family protein [Methanoregula sp.]